MSEIIFRYIERLFERILVEWIDSFSTSALKGDFQVEGLSIEIRGRSVKIKRSITEDNARLSSEIEEHWIPSQGDMRKIRRIWADSLKKAEHIVEVKRWIENEKLRRLYEF